MRAGRLDPWRLELAARCGHPALGGPESPPLALGEWLRALPFERRREEWVRVPLAMGRALEPLARRLGVEGLGDALACAEALHLRPSTGTMAAAVRAQRTLALQLQELHSDLWEWTPPGAAVVRVVQQALDCLLTHRQRVDALELSARAALEPRGAWEIEPGLDAAIEASFPRGEGRLWGLRQAVSRELIEWALGEADPLRAGAERGA